MSHAPMMPGMNPERAFTAGDLAEFASEYGSDTPLLVASHGEMFGVDGFAWDPDEKAIILTGDCRYDLPIAALSHEGDPEGTARMRHRLAGDLAAHMKEVAERIRARYPGT